MTTQLFIWLIIFSCSIIMQSHSLEEFVYAVAAIVLFVRCHFSHLFLDKYDSQFLSVYTILNAGLLVGMFGTSYELLQNPLIVGQLITYLVFLLYPQLMAMCSGYPTANHDSDCSDAEDCESDGSEAYESDGSQCSDSSCNSQCSCRSPSPLRNRRYQQVIELDRENHEEDPDAVVMPLQSCLTAVRYDSSQPIPSPPKLIHCLRKCMLGNAASK
jgi:hypothetical protein